MTREIVINENGDKIPVSVNEVDGIHVIDIDGVEWVRTENYTHATVLYNMICDHITDYMTYKIG